MPIAVLYGFAANGELVFDEKNSLLALRLLSDESFQDPRDSSSNSENPPKGTGHRPGGAALKLLPGVLRAVCVAGWLAELMRRLMPTLLLKSL